MPRFFVNEDQFADGFVTLFGDDAHHISRSLRMAAGEKILVCDGNGIEYECELTGFLPDRVAARVISSRPSSAEPPFFAHVFQGLPKGDKLDTVLQKSVECGASALTTFESSFCVAHAKDENEGKKLERRRRIAAEAAKQCGRGRIPDVYPTVTFREALAEAENADLALFCYEDEDDRSLAEILTDVKADFRDEKRPTVLLMVGSEGGFSRAEAEEAKNAGWIPVRLGNRILRTETAAPFALACLVYELEMKK